MVPYRGTGPALQDVVGGQIGYLCDQVTSLISQVKAGAVRPLAVLAPARSPVPGLSSRAADGRVFFICEFGVAGPARG
jgi:tripartite-type tricarboxylate transporter receptor subunit TctC